MADNTKLSIFVALIVLALSICLVISNGHGTLFKYKKDPPVKYPISFYIIQMILAITGIIAGFIIDVRIFGENQNPEPGILKACFAIPILLACLFIIVHKRFILKRLK